MPKDLLQVAGTAGILMAETGSITPNCMRAPTEPEQWRWGDDHDAHRRNEPTKFDHY